MDMFSNDSVDNLNLVWRTDSRDDLSVPTRDACAEARCYPSCSAAAQKGCCIASLDTTLN